jgi:exo-beta-1,3-glucanase (GH17 family)
VVAQRRGRAEDDAPHALSSHSLMRMMYGPKPNDGELRDAPDAAAVVDLAAIEARVLAAVREYATRRAPASTTAKPPAAAAATATAAGSSAAPATLDMRVPR